MSVGADVCHEMAHRTDSVYDCLYLAAAIEYEAAFVTADRRLARTVGTVLADVVVCR